MKSHHKRKSRYALPLALRMIGSIVVTCSLLVSVPLVANAFSVSGESNTILRMGKTTDKRNLYPAYEYLRLSLTDLAAGKDGSVSFYFGGWGRVDLGDRTTDRYNDGDLQYGYLSYRGNKSNLLINAGRQFVAEGVAAERIDGLYMRNDFLSGFSAASFAGATVVTEPNYDGGSVIYGGRISHSIPKYYSIGVSALKSDSDGVELREEEGVDLWLHPMQQLEAVGRSSYNSLTSGWMEHAYTISYTPTGDLRISADLSNLNYKDYFHHVTTSALSLTNGILDPKEEVLSLGGSIGYNLMKNLALSVDYKNYDYKIAGSADYFGGKATYSLPDSFFAAGFSIHRMSGSGDKLRYDEYRVFASKKLGKTDLTVDFFDVNYDKSVNGIKNTFSLTGAAAYEINEKLKVAADIDYSKSADFDNEVRGFMKLTYAFDVKHVAEGRAKSEK